MPLPLPLTHLIDRLAPSWVDRAVLSKAISFGLIGVVNMSVDFVVFSLGYYALGLTILSANILSWSVAVTGSYVMNSMTTFAAESGRQLRFAAFATFLVSQFAGFVGNTVTVILASYVMPVIAGKLAAVGVSFLINFSLSHFVVFRRQPSA